MMSAYMNAAVPVVVLILSNLRCFAETFRKSFILCNVFDFLFIFAGNKYRQRGDL